MLKMTVTLAVGLYAGLIVFGKPSEALTTAQASTAGPMPATMEFAHPVIVADAERSELSGPPAVRQIPAVAVSDAPVDPMSSLARTDDRWTGEPTIVSLVGNGEVSILSTEVSTRGERLRVTGSRVNLRAGPSTADRVVGSLSGGTLAEPVGESINGWTEVRDVATGVTGFMASRFLEPV